MRRVGTVLQVREVQRGGTLTADYASGTTLYVTRVTGMPESGTVFVQDDQGNSETASYSAIDPNGLTITLDSALSNTYSEGASVTLSPALYDRMAFVQLPGDEGDPLAAIIPIEAYAQFPTGSRLPGQGEAAHVELGPDGWEIVGAPGSQPVIGSQVMLSGDGYLGVLDSSGGNVVEIGASSQAFGNLYVGALYAPNVVGVTTEDATYFVDPSSGDDSANNGLDAGTLTVSSVANGTTLTPTFTTATPHGLSTGDSVVLAGFAPTAYNGTWTVTVGSDTTFQITFGSAPGNVSVYGTATSGLSGTTDANGLVYGPLATIGAAVALLPLIIESDIVIKVAKGATCIEGNVTLSGYLGAGTLTIDGQDTAVWPSTTINGSLLVVGCALAITIQNFTVSYDGSNGGTRFVTGDSVVQVLQSQGIYLSNVSAQGNNALNNLSGSSGFYAESSTVRFDNCGSFPGTYPAAANNFTAAATSTVFLNGCVGSNGADTGIRCNAATVYVGGSTQPSGNSSATSTSNGGQIFGSATSTTGTSSSGGSKTTKYVIPTDSGSWRPNYGGQWSTSLVVQGDSYPWGNEGPYRGLWFYGSGAWSFLSGKTIDGIWIYVTRQTNNGYSASEPLYAFLHNYNTKPGGEPSLGSNLGKIGALAWGQGAWLKLPNSAGSALAAGTAKGIALYTASGNPYVICNAAGKLSGRIKVTFH